MVKSYHSSTFPLVAAASARGESPDACFGVDGRVAGVVVAIEKSVGNRTGVPHVDRASVYSESAKQRGTQKPNSGDGRPEHCSAIPA